MPTEKERAAIWRSTARFLLWVEQELKKTDLEVITSEASQRQIDRAYKEFPSKSERDKAIADYCEVMRKAEENRKKSRR